ncbi:hypothetical protein HN873_016381 [Arachis hypogaea]
MFVMLNIFSLVCIHINSALYSSSFLLAKLPEAYAFLNPIVDIMPYLCLRLNPFLKIEPISIAGNSNLIAFHTSQAAANSGLHLLASRMISLPSRARSRPMKKVVLFKPPIMKSLLAHFTPRNAPFL